MGYRRRGYKRRGYVRRSRRSYRKRRFGRAIAYRSRRKRGYRQRRNVNRAWRYTRNIQRPLRQVGPAPAYPTFTKLYGQQNFNNDAGAGVDYSYSFSANSLIDWSGVAAGDDALWRSQWANAGYNQYCVVAAGIEVKFVNNSTAPIEYMVYPRLKTVSGVGVTTGWDFARFDPNVKRGWVGKDVSGKDMKTVKNYCQVSKLLYGEASANPKNDDQLWTTISVAPSPSATVYWQIDVRSEEGIGLSSDVKIHVVLTFYTKLRNFNSLAYTNQ